MYNAFVAKKAQDKQEQLRKRSDSVQRYVKRYYNRTRPSLIDNYNKRINSFIRRLEEQPIKVSLNLSNKAEQQKQMDDTEENSGNTGKFIGENTFKFKDNQDWKSMYTPWERIQRKKNYDLFRLKYGDPNIAYRSIGSQSEYNPSLSNQFRIRSKGKQINPPMKYSTKSTDRTLNELNKSRKNKRSSQHSSKDLKNNKKNQGQRDQEMIRRNTGSSLSGMNDDFSQNDIISRQGRDTDFNESQREHEQEILKGKLKKQKQMKLHFKQIMDLEQNISDPKTKKALRDLLYKCGVYRKKNRRVATESDADKFSQFQMNTMNQK